MYLLLITLLNLAVSFDGVGTAAEWLSQTLETDVGFCTQMALFVVKEGTLDLPHARYCTVNEGNAVPEAYQLWGEEIVTPVRKETRTDQQILVDECTYYYSMLMKNTDEQELGCEDFVDVAELLRFQRVAQLCGEEEGSLLEQLAASGAFDVDMDNRRVRAHLQDSEEEEYSQTVEDTEGELETGQVGMEESAGPVEGQWDLSW